jgi:8-oxo-dGTP diphosphatase
MLMVDHQSMGRAHFWAPPGGGVEFMESATHALVREFREETGLIVDPGAFLFACELLQPPLHAIELFFNAILVGGDIGLGSDPEAKPSKQIISSVRWMPWEEVEKVPAHHLHGIFKKVAQSSEILDLRGYFKL